MTTTPAGQPGACAKATDDPNYSQLVTARNAARHLLGSGVLVLAEHGNLSRTRKCLVSLGDEPRPLAECEAVLRAKDDHNRAMFLRRHGFDLFRDRERYHAVLCNSHLIPSATGRSRGAASRGSPRRPRRGAGRHGRRAGGLAELRAGYPREVLAVRGMHAERRVTRPEAPVHSLLHCHFESALRALAVARPGELERLRPVFESPAYARATPAGRLSLLDGQVTRLSQGQDIFTREVFAEVVRRLGEEMTSSGIRHVDLRVGVLMHRWPWIGSLADAIGAFRAELPGPDTLTVSFLGAVNLSKPHDVLDAVFGRVAGRRQDRWAAGGPGHQHAARGPRRP